MRRRRHWSDWRENTWFFGRHLHRRLFWWFGGAIAVTALAVLAVQHLLGWVPGRPRALYLLVALFALWSAAGRVARRLARPLARLVRVTQDIGAGNLGARVGSPDGWHGPRVAEIAILGRAVDDMADRIERQLADQKELLAGVSHEIRTPLARLRILVEMARERGPDARTWDELEREILEIDVLCGELLASARLDFATVEKRPLDAADQARRALERAGEPATALQLDAPAPALGFAGDPTLLARALANLLANARRHGGGLDALALRRDGEHIAFLVRDRGPGFAPGDEARVFQTFTRGAGERERPPGSLGLGLSLVRRIARAHGGDAHIANRSDGRGAEVSFLVQAGDGPPAPAAGSVSR